MDAEPDTTTSSLRRTTRKQPVTQSNQLVVQERPRRDYRKRWSEHEKFMLLEALETYGPRELDKIAEVVGTRSRDEVMCAIKYWKKESAKLSMKITFNRRNFNNKSGKGRTRNCKVVDGVELWIEVMLKHGSKAGGKEAFLAVADVVKCIAAFEALPTVEEADGIDFRELYLWLAEMLSGQPIRSLSLATSAFLTQCTRDLSKHAADNLWPRTKAALSRIVDNVWCPQNVKTYSKRPPTSTRNKFINERMQSLLASPGINPIALDKERLPFNQRL